LFLVKLFIYYLKREFFSQLGSIPHESGWVEEWSELIWW